MEIALALARVLVVSLILSPLILEEWREKPEGFRLKIFWLVIILLLVATIPFLFKWLPAGIQASAAGAIGVALFLFGVVFGLSVLRQWAQDEIESSHRSRSGKRGESDAPKEAGALAAWLRVAMKLLVFLIAAVVLCLLMVFVGEWF